MKKESNVLSFIICISSFLTWGLLSIYWTQLKNINAVEIVAHRAVWSFFIAGLLVVILGQGLQIVKAFSTLRLFLALCASSFMIAINWTIYIYAVTHGNIVETSMGYYINPLFNVAASALIFKVKMNRFQMLAVLLAIVGVLNLIVGYGSFPVIALCLATSFCIYGVIRKIIPIDAVPGLFVETCIIMIPSAFYLIYLTLSGHGAFFTASGFEISLLILGGLITTLPLAGFSYGARHLNLSTLGVIQYLSPTTSFLIGVFLYHEVFTTSHLITFIFIWVGLVIYTIDGIVRFNRKKETQMS